MEKNRKKPGKAGTVIVSILLIILLAGNIAGGMYYNVITQFFSKPETDEKAIEETAKTARDVVERIEEEAIVLLQNENNALPLEMSNEKEANVSVFGWSSISPV